MKRKWTAEDHTNAPYTKRSAVDPAENYRWLYNRVADPSEELSGIHDPKPRKEMRADLDAALVREYGSFDLRTPAYDHEGNVVNGLEAVFVRKPEAD